MRNHFWEENFRTPLPASSVWSRCPDALLDIWALLTQLSDSITLGMVWGPILKIRGACVALVDQSNDQLMGEFCHHTVSTIWQYHGGCLVGKVVDHKFRVNGIDAVSCHNFNDEVCSHFQKKPAICLEFEAQLEY
ncbi:(R)-mandelonitrile lyase-like [Cucumis melo var. makuwa]|uniref:(R)-mandelonitrile lyase-like n=1 Tax=Cucumis melo var. makuwa TaxID=1194695 RepID=A0A5D3BZH5_CUCMM|nr:(R)-mandelonitrile lyase-like [Cucumis melo var. makuwa]